MQITNLIHHESSILKITFNAIKTPIRPLRLILRVFTKQAHLSLLDQTHPKRNAILRFLELSAYPGNTTDERIPSFPLIPVAQ